MKILLVILLTGGLIVGVSGVSYANNIKCRGAELQCLRIMPSHLAGNGKAFFMDKCMKGRQGFRQYNYKGKKCNY